MPESEPPPLSSPEPEELLFGGSAAPSALSLSLSSSLDELSYLGQVGRRRLSLPRGLILDSREVGVAVPLYR